jgi:hypothetical protein
MTDAKQGIFRRDDRAVDGLCRDRARDGCTRGRRRERDRNSDSPSLPTAYFHPKVLYFRAGTMSTKTTTLTNPSAETLSIKSFALSGTNNVVMTNNCAPSLAAGASCTVSLTCLPSGSGRIGELTESDNSAVGHHNVELEAN